MSYGLGLDIGGTGIKASMVDLSSGALIDEKIKLKTPEGGLPSDIAEVVKLLVGKFNFKGHIGCGFPSVIKNGIATTASNIHKSWIGLNVEHVLKLATGHEYTVFNDADLAGIGEFTYGNVSDKQGLTLFLTIGTGIGSAIFYNGVLIPNSELGHLKFKGNIAEKFVSNKVRKESKLSWEEFGLRLNEYLNHLCHIFSPDRIILSGGISKKIINYESYLTQSVPVVAASLFNNAGIVGAAHMVSISTPK